MPLWLGPATPSRGGPALATGMDFPILEGRQNLRQNGLRSLKATVPCKDIWLACLGHPSEQAISHLHDVRDEVKEQTCCCKSANIAYEDVHTALSLRAK
jgi:hypothetical protein